MNWLSKITKAASDAGTQVMNNVQQANDLANEWSNKDKAFIHNKFKNGNTIEKMAARKVAKDNGW